MSRVTVRIPGSTSNIGPGFDTLGLALKLYTTLTLELVEKNDQDVPLVRLKGTIAQALPLDETNLIYRTLGVLWKDSPHLLQRLRITIESEIPLTGGLGSSASATLGAVWAASALTGRQIDKRDLLDLATSFEGHPDNVAPSLYGGFVVCGKSANGKRVNVQRLDWPDDWCILVVVPSYTVPTKEARALLPASVPFKDAVSNIGNLALLIAAVVKSDEEAARAALHDRLHEPYRQHLVPELEILRHSLKDVPVLGCVLSGAGSSILVLVARRHKAQVLDFLHNWSEGRSNGTQVLDLAVAQTGLEQID